MYEGSSRIIVTLMMSFFIVIDYYPQQDSDEFYLNGIYALKNADTASAYNYFLKSIKENDNPASYFNLAKLSIASKDPLKRMNILQYFKAAVEYEPSNIQYRFDYAQYLENISKPDRSIGINRRLAFAEYEKIIKIEPNSSPAYFHLGCIKYQDYIEFNRSYQKLTKVPFLKHGELDLSPKK